MYCSTFGEPKGLRSSHQTAVNILIADTGCGIPPDKLDIIFREFEQVESTEQDITGDSGVGAYVQIQYSYLVAQLYLFFQD